MRPNLHQLARHAQLSARATLVHKAELLSQHDFTQSQKHKAGACCLIAAGGHALLVVASGLIVGVDDGVRGHAVGVVGLGPGVDGVDVIEHGHGEKGEHLLSQNRSTAQSESMQRSASSCQPVLPSRQLATLLVLPLGFNAASPLNSGHPPCCRQPRGLIRRLLCSLALRFRSAPSTGHWTASALSLPFGQNGDSISPPPLFFPLSPQIADIGTAVEIQNVI